MHFVPFLFLFPLLIFAGKPQSSSPADFVNIKDYADYFKPVTLKAANQKIQNIKKKFEVDVFIESHTHVQEPKESPQGIQGEDDPHFFDKKIHDWFQSKNAKLPPSSIQVLIVRNPGYIIVGVGRAMRYFGGFKQQDDNTLTKIMQNAFELAKYDEALLVGLEYIEKVLTENMTGSKMMDQARNLNVSSSQNFLVLGGNFIKKWGLSILSGVLILMILFNCFKVLSSPQRHA